MNDPHGPASAADPDAATASWAGRTAFVLGLLSTAAYFTTSLGVRNFAGFVVDALRKAMHAFGIAS